MRIADPEAIGGVASEGLSVTIKDRDFQPAELLWCGFPLVVTSRCAFPR